jgi:branched-chain amino acid transport system permease protein
MIQERRKPNKQIWQARLLSIAPYVVGSLILIVLPLFLSSYFQNIITKILIYAILAMSLNLLLGYTGLLSFGHGAFFAVGGYTAGILMVRYGIDSFWLLAPASIVMTVFVAAIFGIVALRVSGMYFLLITFALGQLVYSVAWKWYSVTGGSDALTGIGRPDLGIPGFAWSDIYFYYFVLVAFVLCHLILYRIVKSPFGHSLEGIRENELRMRSLGYNTWLHKYIAYVIAGLFAGIGGMLYAHFNGLMTPLHAGIQTSGLAMFMVIIGSAGTFLGPIIGAAVVILLEAVTSIFTPERWPLILGCVFVIVMMSFRQGFNVYFIKIWERMRSRYGSTTG